MIYNSCDQGLDASHYGVGKAASWQMGLGKVCCEIMYNQCSKLLPVHLPEADNFFWKTSNFFKDFLQFYVYYDLRFKAGGLTTFLTEFWTVV